MPSIAALIARASGHSRTTLVVAATASSTYPSVDPMKAFNGVLGDGSANTSWVTNGIATGWLMAQLSRTTIVTGYTLWGSVFESTRSPVSWTIQGSNDGITFTTLDTRAGITPWALGGSRTYTFTNVNTYLYYKIDATSNGGSSYLEIAELSFFEAY